MIAQCQQLALDLEETVRHRGESLDDAEQLLLEQARQMASAG
jgi:hypothetical protein